MVRSILVEELASEAVSIPRSKAPSMRMCGSGDQRISGDKPAVKVELVLRCVVNPTNPSPARRNSWLPGRMRST